MRSSIIKLMEDMDCTIQYLKNGRLHKQGLPYGYDDIEYWPELLKAMETATERRYSSVPPVTITQQKYEQIIIFCSKATSQLNIVGIYDGDLQNQLEQLNKACQTAHEEAEKSLTETEKPDKPKSPEPEPPTIEKRILEAYLVREEKGYVLGSEPLVNYAERLNGEKLRAVEDYLEDHKNKFTPDEYRNYKKNLETIQHEANKFAGYVRREQYPDAEQLAQTVLVELFGNKGRNFTNYTHTKLDELRDDEERFRLHEGLVRTFTAYLANLGIMTYNDTKLGDYPSESDDQLYMQESTVTNNPDLRDRICSIERPFYYLLYKSYDDRTLKKSLPGVINIYTNGTMREIW